jgi:hypothetical protein
MLKINNKFGSYYWNWIKKKERINPIKMEIPVKRQIKNQEPIKINQRKKLIQALE